MIVLSLVMRFIRAIPWQLWALLLVLFWVWAWGKVQYGNGYNDRDQEAAEYNIMQEVKFLEMARATERRHQDEMVRISAEFIKQREQNDEAHKRLVADLRAGTVRLRNEWKGCPNRLPETGSPSAGSDENARLREQGAADLVRAGREADQWIQACQAVILSDRKE